MSAARSARWLVLALAAAYAARAPASEAARGRRMWVTGYYAYWQRHMYPIEKIDWSALTHIVAANIAPAEDGNLSLPDPDGTRSNRWAVQIVDAAHAAGKKALLMVGGSWTAPGWRGATSDANRAKFVKGLVQFALKPKAEGGCGFDGIDLDWEPFNGAEDGALLAKVVRDLRAAWPGAILTWPVGPNEASTAHGTISPMVDQVNVMQYGMSGAWPGWVSWHQSALYGHAKDRPASVEATINSYLAVGVAPEKLGLGIGLYASVWTGGNPPVTGPRQPIRGAQCDGYNDNVYTYRWVKEHFARGTSEWDAKAKALSISCPAGCGPGKATWASLESEQSIEEKARYARERGLGGAIVWTLGEGCEDPATGVNPLLAAIKRSFLR